MKRIALVTLLLLLSGCINFKQRHIATMNTWIGHPKSELISKWGIPTREYTNSDGTQLVEFVTTKTTTSGGGPTLFATAGGLPIAVEDPVKYENHHCRYTMFINKEGFVSTWRSEGDICY